MNPISLSPICHAAVACFILTLPCCSTSPNRPSDQPSSRHPNLPVKAANVSAFRLISEVELRGGRENPHDDGRWSAGGFAQTVVAVCANSITFIILLAGSGAVAADESWWLSPPGVVKGTLLKTHVTNDSSTELRFTGNEIRYLPAKTGTGVTLARIRGDALLKVIDRQGSYYCRADEIHYRAATQEVILRGQVSISAVYAPGIHDFGLTRLNLANSSVEYCP